MIEITKIIKNEHGLHARPAANFVTLTKSFKSDIKLKNKNKSANGKSLLSVLSAEIVSGSELTIICDGPDELDAVNAIEKYIDNGCREMIATEVGL